MIAGSIVVFGAVGAEPGLWSKRGSVVALGDGRRRRPPISMRAPIGRRICRLTLRYLKRRYGCPVTPDHLAGLYRRYSGDLAELGEGRDSGMDTVTTALGMNELASEIADRHGRAGRSAIAIALTTSGAGRG